MQAAPARYVSASELYSTDEVELLLEEIRELEPRSCRGEDVQDFEIAGSGRAGAGGRSPAGTELTERSWDSHAHYSRAPPPRPQALAPIYCHLAHLITPTGALTLLLVVCSACTCGCVWSAVGLRSASAVRPLLFGALSSLLLHALMLLLRVSRLHRLMPLHWNRLGGCAAAWSAGWLCAGGARLLGALLPLPPRAPALPARLLFAATGLGLCGACVSCGLVAIALRGGCARRGAGGAAAGRSRRSSARSGSPRAAYRAVPAAPPPAPRPSTSREPPL
ncbi:uncharacterized protein [Epargyreus clarus]|uniref:uncharacterized protein n=1 Tax=Epargyreus clarus TaxID=520877 RepID=UPI003C2AE024